jgi:signal transduction histidine kinase
LQDALADVIGQLWIILCALFVGILAFIVVQVHWSLRPLNRLQRELKSLETGDKQSIEGHFPKEVSPLVSDLNALIFHYQDLLNRARNQSGNLSHSIKTPLSVLKNQVGELPERQRAPLMQSISQLQHHIDYHLSRAKTAGSMNILSAKSRPSERIDAISKAFDKVYAHREVLLVNELDSSLEVAVEKSDLDEILGNLVENAYKWADSLVRVYSAQSGNRITIYVDDNGPGIEQSQIANITKRGYRIDEQTPGSGLGLNIASEMAHSYRGSLNFSQSSMGGLSVALVLVVASS